MKYGRARAEAGEARTEGTAALIKLRHYRRNGQRPEILELEVA